MAKGYILRKDTIIIQRELTELDLFVKEFIDILKKYSNYLIVSGFVSISSGRARGTEDIDIIIPILNKSTFERLFNDLKKNGFWCYQGDDANIVYQYVKKMTNIRFARINEIIPNIEFIPFDKTKKAKFLEFSNPRKMRVKNFEFNIPQLEFEILYKELILKGKKDMEDAKHLRSFFSEILNQKKFKEYRPTIKEELNETKNR